MLAVRAITSRAKEKGRESSAAGHQCCSHAGRCVSRFHEPAASDKDGAGAPRGVDLEPKEPLEEQCYLKDSEGGRRFHFSGTIVHQ